jgi:hypothetical protein
MTAATEAKTEPTKLNQVEPDRFMEAQYKRNEYVINLPADYHYPDLFIPENWKAIARTGKVNVGDEITVRKDDLSLWAKLIVRECIPNHARVVVTELYKKDLQPIAQDVSDDEQFEIKHFGLQDGWGVVNKSTGKMIVKNLKSREAAKSYINADLRPQMIGRL